MSLWEVYRRACPDCGNSDGNLDQGPYADDPDPALHAMVCTSCGRCFDAAAARRAA